MPPLADSRQPISARLSYGGALIVSFADVTGNRISNDIVVRPAAIMTALTRLDASAPTIYIERGTVMPLRTARRPRADYVSFAWQPMGIYRLA